MLMKHTMHISIFCKCSETIGSRPKVFHDTFSLLSSVFVTGFIVGAVAKTNETTEAFKRHNQLTVYTDKKVATVMPNYQKNYLNHIKIKIK